MMIIGWPFSVRMPTIGATAVKKGFSGLTDTERLALATALEASEVKIIGQCPANL